MAAASARFALGPELRLLGAGYLLVVGLRTARRRLATTAPPTRLARAWGETFLLTLSNPMTIASFAAMFAAIGFDGGDHWTSGVLFAAGVFIGSGAWWLLLSAAASWARDRLSNSWLDHVNRVSGGLLMGLGVWTAWTVVGG